MIHLRQGVNRAPASCFPLPDDLGELGDDDNNGVIAQTQAIFDLCDDCKHQPGIQGTEVVPEVVPEIPDVEETGSYSDGDAYQVAILRELLLTSVRRAENNIQVAETLFTTQAEHVKAAVRVIQNQRIRDLLLRPGNTKYEELFLNSFRDCEKLLRVLDLYMIIRVPCKIFSELFGLVRNKLCQTDARMDDFFRLSDYISRYNPETKSYEAAIETYAENLATRLGQPAVPDAAAFAHLTSEASLPMQEEFKAEEARRRKSIADHESTIKDIYIPRSSFGDRKKKSNLTIDTNKATQPSPQTFDLHQFPEIEHIYDTGLHTRIGPKPLGIGTGPWGISSVLEKTSTTADTNRKATPPVPRDDKLLSSSSPDSSCQVIREAGEAVTRTEPTDGGPLLAEDTMFMGVPLSDTESERSDYFTADESDVQESTEEEWVQANKRGSGGCGDGGRGKKRKYSA